MAQQQSLMDQRKLCCSICLDLLNEPVTIPCGHSYCTSCIERHWDEGDQMKIYSCPQCRLMFLPRPILGKNTMLADLVEELRKPRVQAAPADICYARPEDISCDCCTGRKLKALKSCLQCLVSYCEQHLLPHYDSPAFEKHKLVNPFRRLKENICTHHGKVMRIFCRTDQQCICYLCSMEKHKDHDTVLASTERTERQGELGTHRQRLQQRIHNIKKEVNLLELEVEAINRSADQAVEASQKMTTELVHLVETGSSDVKQQIRSQQKTKVSSAKELQEKLEQEITQLRWKDAELEQLSDMEDHIQFLHNYLSLSLGESAQSPRIDIIPRRHFENVTAAVSEARGELQAILSDAWAKISPAETGVDVLLPPTEPQTRPEFLQHLCPITMDPNSTHTQLVLSEGSRKATVTSEKQAYSIHRDRFIDMFQALSRESLSERHYWEVERGKYEVSVAVAYKDISRKGYESGFGNDVKSWALECFNKSYEFRHGGIGTLISGPQLSRVGVYLDHSAGTLSFYSISEAMTLLHRVQTTFTQPLYAGLGVFASLGSGSTAEFCKLEQCPVLHKDVI